MAAQVLRCPEPLSVSSIVRPCSNLVGMSFGSETQETCGTRAVCVLSSHRVDTSRAHVWLVHFSRYLCLSCQTCLPSPLLLGDWRYRRFLFIPPTLRLSMACLAKHEALTSVSFSFPLPLPVAVNSATPGVDHCFIPRWSGMSHFKAGNDSNRYAVQP